MATEPTKPKRIQLDLPPTWLPQLDAASEDEGRSRHNMILRLIREGLDQRGWKSNAKAG